MSDHQTEWDINAAIESVEDAIAKVRIVDQGSSGATAVGEDFLRYLRKARVVAWRASRAAHGNVPPLPPNYDEGVESKTYFDTHRVSLPAK